MAGPKRKPREWTAEELEAMRQWEIKRAREGMCPAAGLPLTQGPDGLFSCSICDCNGYTAEEVGHGADRG